MTAGVSGFRFSGIAAGIKRNGRRDLALVVAEKPAVAAGIFTRDLVRAAPVVVAEQRVRFGTASAVLVNSGTANACTGEAGMQATLDTTAAIAKALELRVEHVLPASTGVIGLVLPADKVIRTTGELVSSLSPDGVDAFAEAILTTDRFPKVAHAEIEGGATILGIAKGAGMIHPDVGVAAPHATMLVFLFTDAVIGRDALEEALVQAADATFNCVSVDGDTSTNDTVIALASGASEVSVTAEALVGPMTQVCDELARAMVKDGEGASHVAEIRVSGLTTDGDAHQIAKTVATSVLVKTAMFGQDANWGRILAAAGRAGVHFDPARACISVGNVEIVHDGLSVGAEAEQRAGKIMAGESYTIDVVLGDGPGKARYLTSDLGHAYVDVNAGYRS